MSEPLTPESQLNPHQESMVQRMKRDIEGGYMHNRDSLIPGLPRACWIEMVSGTGITIHDGVEIHHRAGLLALHSELEHDIASFEKGAKL